MILGITGTIGAGKGTVVSYLMEKGFEHHSVREFLLEEIRARGLPEDRSSMRDVANELRRDNHPAHVVETLHARAEGTNAIIESIRTVGEAEFLKALGAKIIAVDADKKTRYDRAIARGSSTDKVSFDQFVAEEDREMRSTEHWDMNVFAVMDMADFKIENNGTEEELREKLDRILVEVGE